MKGIILAGGAGTRLYPITRGVNKHLLPVYDKPLIFYPLSLLMLTGIREILLIATPEDVGSFERLLGDGSDYGVSIQYAVQDAPNGLPEAFLIGREFIDGQNVALVLGDNLFYGHRLQERLQRAAARPDGATIFAYHVRDPQRYGVAEFDDEGQIIGLEEKPEHPRSPWAITGIYFYDADVVQIAEGLEPSKRGELEICDLNRAYLQRGALHVERLKRGFAWLDTGTTESLLHASNFIHALTERQGLQVACLEEIAYRMEFIDAAQFERLVERVAGTPYGQYLKQVLEEDA